MCDYRTFDSGLLSSSQTWATWWSCLCAAAWTNMIWESIISTSGMCSRAMFVPGLNLRIYSPVLSLVSSQHLLSGFITTSVYKTWTLGSCHHHKCLMLIFHRTKVDWTFQTQWRKRIIYPMFNKEMRKSFIHSWCIFYTPSTHTFKSRVFCDLIPILVQFSVMLKSNN